MLTLMLRLSLLLLLASCALARQPSVDDLAWISGHWSATIGDSEVEEIWLAPRGNLMTGMSRTVKKDGRVAFEFVRIAKTEDGIAYLAQPSGRPPTAFKLVESKHGRAVFTNPEHDFPKRIVYELRDGKLCARVDDGKDGNEWCWTRVR